MCQCLRLCKQEDRQEQGILGNLQEDGQGDRQKDRWGDRRGNKHKDRQEDKQEDGEEGRQEDRQEGTQAGKRKNKNNYITTPFWSFVKLPIVRLCRPVFYINDIPMIYRSYLDDLSMIKIVR